ncbi:MAG: spore coat protein CotJB [Clostridia bacterium]|nr:spore coat protein CotJB [Clostridia bacterium]
MTRRPIRPTFHESDQPALQNLQAIDFALQDTVLYLDAYPEEKEALDYYHALLERRAELLEQLSPDHPLTVYDNIGDTWNWGKNPWPWEVESN